MARTATNKLLQKAKISKSDEFYTQYCDIERELKHYQGCFKDKVVYCNCDDVHQSNFFRYFVNNFHLLGLNKLIVSCYKEQMNDLFCSKKPENGFWYEYSGNDGDNFNFEDISVIHFKGSGDFRSPECVELLKQSDIIVTNPPFSLFRDFVSQIVKYDKQFLIIGNVNAITYKEIFDLIQTGKAWLGVNLGRGISGFIVPDNYDQYGTEVSINNEGQKIIATNSCLWLTNLELAQRYDGIVLTKEYYGHEEQYPLFDNCNGINVSRTQDIPKDYFGLMGVPITFLHKYNPNQFEIVRFRKGDDGKDLCVNGKCPYFRILIKHKMAQVLQNTSALPINITTQVPDKLAETCDREQ